MACFRTITCNAALSASRLAWIAKLFSLLLLVAPASTVRGQFLYTTNNGAIIITGYTGQGGSVMIPTKITGLPVTGVGSWAFYSTSITNITQSRQRDQHW